MTSQTTERSAGPAGRDTADTGRSTGRSRERAGRGEHRQHARAPGRDAGRHVPHAGTAEAAAIEKARSEMLRDAKPLNRTRIGADALCEALIRQGVDVIFGYPGGVILPLYDVWADYPELRTSSSATSREPHMLPTATPAPAAGSASASAPAAPAPRTS